jgi:hypothetical protein
LSSTYLSLKFIDKCKKKKPDRDEEAFDAMEDTHFPTRKKKQVSSEGNSEDFLQHRVICEWVPEGQTVN